MTTTTQVPDRFTEVVDPEAEQAEKLYRDTITDIAKAGNITPHVKRLRECRPYTPTKPLSIEYRYLHVLALRLWNDLSRAKLAILKPMGRKPETIVSDLRDKLFERLCKSVATTKVMKDAKAATKKVEGELTEFLAGADERHTARFYAERDGKDVSVACAQEKSDLDRLSHLATEARDYQILVETIHLRKVPAWVTS